LLALKGVTVPTALDTERRLLPRDRQDRLTDLQVTRIRSTAQPYLRSALGSQVVHLRTMGRLGVPFEIETG
jgi:hypothetical protein